MVGDESHNSLPVAGPVNVTISKAAGTVSFAISKIEKLNTDAPFTNELTLTGDGSVTYMSDNTAVATADATTGEVTIVGTGQAAITATVTDGTNYTYATNTARYALTVTEDPAIGISALPADKGTDVWYDLKGRKLPGKPRQKGVYLCNGRKTVVN